jgi:hypothetical protein
MIDAEQLNNAVEAWLKETVALIKADLLAKGVKHSDYSKSEKPLTDLIRGRAKKKLGMATTASVIFPRHLVFVKYGVGKHRAKGSGKESPKDIVDNIIEAQLPKLADAVANAYADIVVRGMFIDKSRR